MTYEIRLPCGHYADNDACDDSACQGDVNMDWLIRGDTYDTERTDDYRRSKRLMANPDRDSTAI